jgi:hypothetical protein
MTGTVVGVGDGAAGLASLRGAHPGARATSAVEMISSAARRRNDIMMMGSDPVDAQSNLP